MEHKMVWRGSFEFVCKRVFGQVCDRKVVEDFLSRCGVQSGAQLVPSFFPAPGKIELLIRADWKGDDGLHSCIEFIINSGQFRQLQEQVA